MKIYPRLSTRARFALVFAVFLLFNSPPIEAANLDEVIKYTLENSTKLKATIHQHKAARVTNLDALAAFTPNASLHYISKLPNDYANFRSTYGDLTQKIRENDFQISVRANIFNFGRDLANLKASIDNSNITEHRLNLSISDLIIKIVSSYVNVAGAHEMYQLSKSKEEVFNKHHITSKKRFDVGEITLTEVLQAEARASEAVASRIQAEGNLKNSQTIYYHVTGLDPENIEVVRRLPNLPKNIEMAFATAEIKSDNIQAAKLATKSSKAIFLGSIANFLPSLSLEYTYDHHGSPRSYPPYGRPQNSMALSLNLPLFNLSYITSLAKTRQESLYNLYNYQDVYKAVKEEVLKTWEELSTANSVLKARKTAVRALETALKGVKEEAAHNLLTTLDVLDAEQRLFDEKLNVVRSTNNKILATYKLLAVTGSLNEIYRENIIKGGNNG